MNMKKLFSISALLLALGGSAHADVFKVVLTSIDAVEPGFRDGNGRRLSIVGVPANQPAALEYLLFFAEDINHAACLQAATVAMNRPGRFQLQVTGSAVAGDTWVNGASCRLIANH
jgi:hypothetical protein